ncbi:MAG: hypothetical protein ACRDQ5_24120 [Sciscionella sp.]
MPAYGAQDRSGAFARSFEVFTSIVTELEAEESEAWTHATLEDHLSERSQELMRQLYQDRFDSQTLREQHRTDIVGADQVARTRVERGHQRALTTVFGEVTVTRKAYRAPKTVNLYPAEEVLNLPEGKHCDGLAKLAVIESVRGSCDAAIEAITRATGIALGTPQLLALAARAAIDVPAFYAPRRPPTEPGHRCAGHDQRRQGHPHAPRRTTRDHPHSRRYHHEQARHPVVTRGEIRSETEGGTRRRL